VSSVLSGVVLCRGVFLYDQIMSKMLHRERPRRSDERTRRASGVRRLGSHQVEMGSFTIANTMSIGSFGLAPGVRED
jgi:hypothetical protein